MYYNLKKHKEFFYLDLFVYLIPVSIILGNLIINIVLLISTTIFLLLVFKKKTIYKNYRNFFYFFYFILIIYIFNILLSSDYKLTLISLLGFIRYYILFLIILFCLNEIKDFKIVFSKIIFFLVLFVIIDILIQNFFLVDIFGNKIQSSHGRRLSGPFGEESVAGTFISKLFFISILYIFDKKFIKKFIIPLLILTIITVILTNERSASIMFFASSIIFFLFYKLNIIYKTISLIFIFFIIVTTFYLNNNLKTHFIDVPINAFKDNHHRAHFLTALEIFKDNKFFGSGIKTFRSECNNEKYNTINTKFVNNRCSTHPHNIYLEIISESGILGFFLIIFINLYILFFLIINFFKKTHLRQEILILFCSFFILFWPLQTTGSFFSTWNGIFYWIFFSHFFNFKRNLTI